MKKRGIILAGIMLAMFLSALDQTIVSTALPQITEQFNALSHLSWVFTAYMLASTITVPIYGKLSDIFGRRGLYILGIVIFLAGSALSGLSQNMTQLIIFRGLQGIGGGAMMVNSVAIIGDLYSPAERGRYQGLLMAMFGVATIAGPLLGGWITDQYSWRWIFYINIPLGAIAIAVLASTMPKIVHNIKGRSIDYLGAFLLTAGLVPLLLAFVWAGGEYAWGSWQILTLFGISVLAFIAFAIAESKVKEPIVSLNLFRNKVFSVSVLTTFLTSMGMFGAIIYIPVFAQGVIGVSATNSGIILMPMMLGLIVASTLSGQIISRTGKYKVLAITGMIITFIGMFLFTQLNVDTSNTNLALRMILLGIGMGMTMPIFMIAVQSAFSITRLGEVTAGSQLFRSIGGTIGTSVLGGVMTSQLTTRLSGLSSDPFVNMMEEINPGIALDKMDANTIQGFLTPDGQAQIQQMLAQVPANMQDQVTSSFAHFLETIKVAFSNSMDQVYIVGTILMGVALIAIFFLPEIKLRKSNQPAVEETEIQAGLGLGIQTNPESNLKL
jgi:EmrB/QacA subfamily drug resistance transporter